MRTGESAWEGSPDTEQDGSPSSGSPAPNRAGGWLGSLTLLIAPFLIFALLLTLDRILR